MFIFHLPRALIFSMFKLRNVINRIPTRCFGTVLSLEGNIASGKTSVLHEMKKYLPQSYVHEEPVDKWRNLGGQNILDLMYQDTKRWAFLFQSYVQLTMFAIHQNVVDNPGSMHILERSIYSARYCFVENFRKHNLITDVEFEVIDGWFRFLTDASRCPLNLIVYLRTSPECVYQRILNRARPEERVVSLEYVEQLHERHEEWLLESDGARLSTSMRNGVVDQPRKMLPECPVLVVDATLPLNQIKEQIRDDVVPTIEKQVLQREHCRI